MLNLIEPTLFDQTGHSYTYVQCLLEANKQIRSTINVWCDKRGADLFKNQNCTIHPFFYRPLRQIYKIFLYRRLIQQSGIIFVSTAELWDLKLLSHFAKKYRTKVKAKIFLQFHQFKQTPKKIASLVKIAARDQGFNIITPTAKLADIFINRGFKSCTVIPCPTYHPAPKPNNTPVKFSKILYAGAARNDKGFPAVIDALQYNRQLGKDTAFEIQTSPPNSQRYDKPTLAALEKLKSISKNNLIIHNDTLTKEQYLDLFTNAICLLIYNQKDYQDKFSAVALDAFYAGSPIITAKNTWMGDMAEEYQAGVTLAEYTPENIQQAIDFLIANYEKFNANAKQAAQQLAELHDPRHTLEFLLA